MALGVYIADISGLIEAGLYDKLYRQMPEDRRRRCDRFKFQEDKLRCVAAYGLLNAALDGIRPEIGYKDTGKPYLVNHQELFFNLSHSGNKVMCAVAASEIGCDVEKLREHNLMIAKRFFHNDEYIYLEKSREAGRDDFTKLWSLKESVLKCSGDGIGYPMNAFSLLDEDEIRDYIYLKDSNIRYYIKSFDKEDGYESAVCSTAPVNTLELKKVVLG